MAKIAVIFVLFALCSVAMSARITREEPSVIQPFVDSWKAFLDSASQFAQSPQTQAQLKNIQENTQELAKKSGAQLEESAGELGSKIQDLLKNSEGSFKDLLENVKKTFDETIKPKKN